MTEATDTANQQEGGCQCGAVRYRVSEPPFKAMACHCTTCKLRTGAAYGIGVYYEQADIDILHGEMSKYRFNSDTSGRWMQNEFCTECGTTVLWSFEMRPGIIGIAGGSFDNPDWFDIEAHIWTRSARSDMRYPDGMLVCEEVFKDAGNP